MRIQTLYQHVIQTTLDIAPDINAILKTKDHPVNIASLLRKLNDVTEPLGIRNEWNTRDKTCKPGLFKMSGLWLYDESLPASEQSIRMHICWYTHPSRKQLDMAYQDWSRLRYRFWSTLFHECIHDAQMRLRNGSTERIYIPQAQSSYERKEQNYYGRYDELEAYAHDAAMEFILWWDVDVYRDIVTMSMQPLEPPVKESTYCHFLNVFSSTPDHPAIASFKRKTRQWYELLLPYTPMLREVYELESII